MGRSPRMRRKPRSRLRAGWLSGSIPACSGRTAKTSIWGNSIWVDHRQERANTVDYLSAFGGIGGLILHSADPSRLTPSSIVSHGWLLETGNGAERHAKC